jgi:EAL domain-containing protein (putative c-di-GMP-specific phosphodiesterase class I)
VSNSGGSKRSRDRALREELRAAILGGELLPHYQPLVDLADRTVLRFEALARWPRNGAVSVSPAEFIPVAERNGLMPGLSALMLERATGDLRGWRRRWPDLRVALNLSAQSIRDPHLPDDLARRLERLDAAPDWLSLEITETMLISDPARGRENVERLRALGAQVALDDFGTGYSSLGYLAQLAVSTVKIDRRLLIGMLADGRSEKIVRAIVGLCRELELESVAEGVEDEAAMSAVAAFGCSAAQGHWIAAPMPAEDVPAWVARWHRDEAATRVPGGSRAAPGGTRVPSGGKEEPALRR